MKLNVGCGRDPWGDVRLELSSAPRTRIECMSSRLFGKKMANFVGDAENLPFRDRVFSEIRADSILEHLDNPVKAASEIARVLAGHLEIRFPQTSGDVDYALWFLSKGDLGQAVVALMCRVLRDHKWRIERPDTIVQALNSRGVRTTLGRERAYHAPFAIIPRPVGQIMKSFWDRMPQKKYYLWVIKGDVAY